MKKFIALTALLALYVTPAKALDPYSRNDSGATVDRGREVFNEETGARERIGVTCSLYLDNRLIHEGYCKVGRRDSVTVIYTGKEAYKIVRDSPNAGRFYSGLDNSVSYGFVRTQGNCWSSTRVQFCAD